METLDWLQVDCSLFPQQDRSPYLPWSSLLEATHKWRAQNLFHWFWFVRKMPGLKLRFGGPNIAARLQGPLAEWLHTVERANDIRGFRFTVYEPETYRFGGEAGMALAHSHFNSGSQLVLDYETSEESLPKTLDRLTLSLANTTDLLDRALADQAERWDVWNRLYAAVAETDSQHNVTDAPAIDLGFENLPGEQSSELAQLIARAQAANDACADSLRGLVTGGVLSVGMRSWLAAATTFEWNRFGLPDHPEQLAAAIAMILRQHQPDTFP